MTPPQVSVTIAPASKPDSAHATPSARRLTRASSSRPAVTVADITRPWRGSLRTVSLDQIPALQRPVTPPYGLSRPITPSLWQQAKPIARLAAQNVLTAGAAGVLFATRNVGRFHGLGIGKTGLLALYATPGGWAAAACHTLSIASAIFGAAWGRSRATPDDPRGIGQFYARHWPAVVLSSTLALSGALGLVSTLPAAVALGLACTYLAVTAAQASLGACAALSGDVTSQTMASSFAIGLCFGLSSGLPVSLALLHATTLMAASMIIGFVLHLSMRVFQQEFPTTFTDSLMVRSRAIERTRMAPGLASAPASGESGVQTVFQTPQTFAEGVRELAAALDEQPSDGFAGFLGQPVLTVYGAPGGGKSTSGVALAQALSRPGHPASVRVVHRDDLEQNQLGDLPVMALNLACALLECDFRGRRDGAPVVLLIEEIESIFPDLNAPKVHSHQSDENLMKSTGFLFFVQLLHLLSQSRSGVVVVATTNFAPDVKPLLDMVSTRAPVFFAAPTAETQRDIVVSQLASLSEALAKDHGLPMLPLVADKDRLDQFLSAIGQRQGGLSGRDLTSCLRYGTRAALAMVARAQRTHEQPTSEQFVARIYERMHDALQNLPLASVSSEPSATQPPADRSQAPSEAASANASARPSSDEVLTNAAHVLKRLHVSDMEAAEVFERLSQSVVNFGKRYADPTNTASIAQLKLRLARTAFLFTTLLLRADLETLPRRQFHDVPEVSPLKQFFGGESPKAWKNFGRSVKTWASLNSAAVLRVAHHVYGLSGLDLEQAATRVQMLKSAVNHLPQQARSSLSGASNSLKGILHK